VTGPRGGSAGRKALDGAQMMAGMGTDAVWRPRAIASLICAVIVTLAFRGDFVGGDEHHYLALARDFSTPSRFPPGLALLLSPVVGSLTVVRWVMTGVAVALVVSIWWAARLLGGWRAAAVAGVLLVMSPRLIAAGSEVMADKLGALLLVLGLIAVHHSRHVVAGLLVGFGGWVRLAHVAFVAALPRRTWAAGAAVVGGLVVWQLAFQGTVVGYGEGEASWSLGHLLGHAVNFERGGVDPYWPNVAWYPAVLLGWGGVIAPLAVIPAGWAMWRRRGEEVGRLALGVVALNLLIYLPYYWQAWRLLDPAAAMVLVFAAVALGSDCVADDHDAGAAGSSRKAKAAASAAATCGLGLPRVEVTGWVRRRLPSVGC